jgi:hypothetical protein
MTHDKPSGVAAAQAVATDIGRALQGEQPAAWAAFADDSGEQGVTNLNREAVEEFAAKLGWNVTPLYRKFTQWIPVGERLPEEYETVLVATDGSVSAGEIRFPDSECGMDEPWWMVFKDKRDRSVAWAGLVPLNDVTHWMPLPAPPEVK